MKSYRINEIFYSLQGEGARIGQPSLFLRFSKCNLICKKETHGFDCDTEFETGDDLTIEEILTEFRSLSRDCRWVVLTGGEPALQVDVELIEALHAAGYKLAIETNGTVELPAGLDWITVSPKVTEDEVRQRVADEVKYVLGVGRDIPETEIEADHYWISPAFDGDQVDPRTIEWCTRMVQENPQWGLSVQMHKIWGVR